MEKQVNKDHYDFSKYVHKGRWMSYYYQVGLIDSLNPNSILEIGPGTNFLKKYFSDKNIEYRTLDIAEDTDPDYIGGVENMTFPDNSFDLVCAFQVLEHLPFNKFDQSLKEISRVSSDKTLISLPYSRFRFGLELNIPRFRDLNASIDIPKFWKKHEFDGEHYWEIGKRGYPLKKIKGVLEDNFNLNKTIHPYENKYHVFFVLDKKS